MNIIKLSQENSFKDFKDIKPQKISGRASGNADDLAKLVRCSFRQEKGKNNIILTIFIGKKVAEDCGFEGGQKLIVSYDDGDRTSYYFSLRKAEDNTLGYTLSGRESRSKGKIMSLSIGCNFLKIPKEKFGMYKFDYMKYKDRLILVLDRNKITDGSFDIFS